MDKEGRLVLKIAVFLLIVCGIGALISWVTGWDVTQPVGRDMDTALLFFIGFDIGMLILIVLHLVAINEEDKRDRGR